MTMPEHKYIGKSPEQRIKDRQKGSGSYDTADTVVRDGDKGTITAIHNSGHQMQHNNPHGSRHLVDDTGNTKVPVGGGSIMGNRKG
jgi:hypothetical protein